MAVSVSSLADLPDESQIATRLIHLNLDTVNNIQAGMAESLPSDVIRKTCEALIEDRSTFIGELKAYVRGEGVIPAGEEAHMHTLTERFWRTFKIRLFNHDYAGTLDELAKAEKCVKDEYEKALREANGTHLHNCLVLQHERVLASSEHIQSVRESL